MEHETYPLGTDAPVGEILLAEVAIRVELPPSWHKRAVDRYEAVRKHIERIGSPLQNHVELFYPQGSMAIGATIRARKRDTGYDIDIVAELNLPSDTPPETVLDMLFTAINGPQGSRYHGQVERQTRCVTVYYEDGMHLDVTPSILRSCGNPRESWIFHAPPYQHPEHHKRLIINSHAFARWFKDCTPGDMVFAEAYNRRAIAYDKSIFLADAEAEPVPEHPGPHGMKSATVVALQLLKRHRNIRYLNRNGGRVPPSVFMSCCAGEAAIPGASISQALMAISNKMLQKLGSAQRSGQLVDVRNPECTQDKFTDRWPENLKQQQIYIDDLEEFQKQLRKLLADSSLEEQKALLAVMFGEDPSSKAVASYAEQLGRHISTGNSMVTGSGTVVASTNVGATPNVTKGTHPPRHTFYGGKYR